MRLFLVAAILAVLIHGFMCWWAIRFRMDLRYHDRMPQTHGEAV